MLSLVEPPLVDDETGGEEELQVTALPPTLHVLQVETQAAWQVSKVLSTPHAFGRPNVPFAFTVCSLVVTPDADAMLPPAVYSASMRSGRRCSQRSCSAVVVETTPPRP